MNDLPSYSGGFTVVGGTRESPLESLREIWRFRPLIAELVRRDLKVRYKNRVGGVLWSLFTPLMSVLTIHLMVKFFVGAIANYSVYLMPVMFLWQFFQSCVLDSANSMVVNASLARKIYFPRAILALVTLLTNLLHFGVSLAFTVVYFFIPPVWDPTAKALYPTHLHPHAVLVIPIVIFVGMLALGIGYLLAYSSTLYEDIRYVSVTLLGLFFYAIPVLYPIERVATRPDLYQIYMLNPLASLLVGFQRLLLPPLDVKGTTPVQIPWNFIGIAALSSLAVLGVGFLIFERSKWMMMERL